MRNWLLYASICMSGFIFKNNKSDITKWVVAGGCSLKVDGSTNVNSFSCAITNYSQPDTILVFKNNQPVQLNGYIRLNVQSFDCHNRMMTADLRKTLKMNEHPKLMIRFVSINKYPDALNKQELTKGMVVIELAGVSKSFDVEYKVVSTDGGYLNLIGTRKVLFSDFNLTPPRKLGGMIRTNNDLSVVFDLKLKVLHS